MSPMTILKPLSATCSLEHLEGLEDGDAGVDHRRQLAREEHHVVDLDVGARREELLEREALPVLVELDVGHREALLLELVDARRPATCAAMTPDTVVPAMPLRGVLEVHHAIPPRRLVRHRYAHDLLERGVAAHGVEDAAAPQRYHPLLERLVSFMSDGALAPDDRSAGPPR